MTAKGAAVGVSVVVEGASTEVGGEVSGLSPENVCGVKFVPVGAAAGIVF